MNKSIPASVRAEVQNMQETKEVTQRDYTKALIGITVLTIIGGIIALMAFFNVSLTSY
jgi:hypothetical protein